MIAAITARCPPAPGWARQSTIEVAIAPGPATSGVASGTRATSSVAACIADREVGAAQHLERDQHQQRPPAIESEPSETCR